MNTYHKIQGLYYRYAEGNKKGGFIIGKYSSVEFELLKDITWEWTEKIDGTNIRIIWNGLDEKIEFKGKTDNAHIPTRLLAKLQETIKPEKLPKVFGKDDNDNFPIICLYGEGYGYKIQNGCKYFCGEKKVGFVLFDIKIGNTWLKREDVIKIADQLGIKAVPVIRDGTIDEAIDYVKMGIYSVYGNFIAEGLVIRPKIELRDRRGYRIITKIKYKDFKED